MIVVNALIKTTPEAVVALQTAIGAMELASREEAGCLDYTFSVEVNDSSALRITEKWRSLEDLKAHFGMPHMAAFQAAMGEQPPESMDVQFYEVEEINPF